MTSDLLDHVKSLSNPPIFDRSNKFIYFPINKNAQTSIARNILANRAIIRKTHSKEWTYKSERLSIDEFLDIYKFVIVRNPFNRVVSAYNYLMNKIESFKCSYENISFDTFILEHLFDAKRNEFVDLHFETQYEKVFFNGQQFPDYVARFETLEKDWLEIKERIGCDLPLVHKNKSTSFYKLKRSRRRYFKSNDVVDLIINHYQKDFDLLGYDKDPKGI